MVTFIITDYDVQFIIVEVSVGLHLLLSGLFLLILVHTHRIVLCPVLHYFLSYVEL
jgi:hypothetical protein